METPNVSTFGFTGFACYLPRMIGTSAKYGDMIIVDASQAHYNRYANEDWQAPGAVSYTHLLPMTLSTKPMPPAIIMQTPMKTSQARCIPFFSSVIVSPFPRIPPGLNLDRFDRPDFASPHLPHSLRTRHRNRSVRPGIELG